MSLVGLNPNKLLVAVKQGYMYSGVVLVNGEQGQLSTEEQCQSSTNNSVELPSAGQEQQSLHEEKVPDLFRTIIKLSDVPIGLAVDESRNTIVVTGTTPYASVEVFSKEGKTVLRVPKNDTFVSPANVTCSISGDMYVCDLGQACVFILDGSGNVKHRYQPPEYSGLRHAFIPSDVCCDPDDNLLIADKGNNVLHLVSPSGSFLGISPSGYLIRPMVLAFDRAGKLWVGDCGDRITIFHYRRS
jgi:hypothetical protein